MKYIYGFIYENVKAYPVILAAGAVVTFLGRFSVDPGSLQIPIHNVKIIQLLSLQNFLFFWKICEPDIRSRYMSISRQGMACDPVGVLANTLIHNVYMDKPVLTCGVTLQNVNVTDCSSRPLLARQAPPKAFLMAPVLPPSFFPAPKSLSILLREN